MNRKHSAGLSFSLDHGVLLTEDVSFTVQLLTQNGAREAWPLTKGRDLETAGLWIGSTLIDVTRLEGADNTQGLCGVMLRPIVGIWETCGALAEVNYPHTAPLVVGNQVEGLSWRSALLGELLPDGIQTFWLRSGGGKSLTSQVLSRLAGWMPFKSINRVMTGNFVGVVEYDGELAHHFYAPPPQDLQKSVLEVSITSEYAGNWAKLGSIDGLSLVDASEAKICGIRMDDGSLVEL